MSARTLGARGAEPEPTATDATHAARTPVSNALRANGRLMTLFLVINLTAATLWFFRGSAWAARVPAAEGTVAVDAATLRERLLDLNDGASLRSVTEQADGSLAIEWATADRRWLDLAGVQRVTEIQRLLLHIDDRSHMVRVEEFVARVDLSAGPGGLAVAWQASRGIQFFRIERSSRIGLALDGASQDGATIDISIDGQALKAPVIAAVTESGWTWQPVVWAIGGS